MVSSNFGIDYLKKGIGIEKFWIGIEVCYKKNYQYNGTKLIQDFGSFYIYIYIRYAHWLYLIKMVWILWAPPTTLLHHHILVFSNIPRSMYRMAPKQLFHKLIYHLIF